MLPLRHETRLVMVWGPPRSGTTWLFNLTTSVLDAGGIPYVRAQSDEPLSEIPCEGAVVIKSHQPIDPALLNGFRSIAIVRCFAILRDPCAAFQSLLRTQRVPRAELLQWLETDIDALSEVSSSLPPLRMIREEWIAERGAEIATRVAEELQLTLPERKALEIAAALDKEQVASLISGLAEERGWRGEFDEFDEDTHWHANHISPDDYVPEPLTAEEEQKLAELSIRVNRLTDELSIFSTAAVKNVSSDFSPTFSPLELFDLAREGLRVRESEDQRPGIIEKMSHLLRRGRGKAGISS
jgi:hypothetical protein